MIVPILFALVGVASALFYLIKGNRIDALLVLLAAAGLAGLTGHFRLPAGAAGAVTIDSRDEAPSVGDAARITLKGEGLRAAQWQDMPARPLEWKAPEGDAITLDFPRTLQLGRLFTLKASMPAAASRRLQLLAENGQVIAEASGKERSISVSWMPPVAQTVVLKARLLDAAGKTIAQGPLPFEVQDNVPLQVQGRFASPSFDARVLNDLLARSNAVLDWQVTLGKTVTRNETARTAITQPNLIVADAAYLERLPAAARGALLAQVAAGTPLMVLAANAGEPQFWARSMQLELKEQAESKPAATGLAMLTAPYNPVAKGPWRAAGDRLWLRDWEKGRIVWVGVSEWHRYAISEPQALGLWWQELLDRAGVRREEGITWLEPPEMPLPGQRMEVCALGVHGEVTFPSLRQTLAWQRRPDRADASCVAVWPDKAGWFSVVAQNSTRKYYVYQLADWPQWQAAQRREVTLAYAARTPTTGGKQTRALPDWPFALLFALSILLLWWRERR